MLNAYNTSYITYQWQDGSSDSKYKVNRSGTYSVQVKDACNRIFKDTILVTFQAPVKFDIGADISMCQMDSLSLHAPAGFVNYQWTPSFNILGSNEETAVVFPSAETTYFVKAQTTSGCPVDDSVRIKILPVKAIYLGRDTSICKGDSLILTAGEGFKSYMWNTGVTNQKLTVNKEGMYSIKALNQNGCYSYDTLAVLKLNNLPVIQLNKDSFLCTNGSRMLDAGAGYISYHWNTGSLAQQITVNNIGYYNVAVIDQNGCNGYDSVIINKFHPQPSGFLFGDTSICNYGTLLLKPLSNFTSYLWSTGEQTEFIEIKKSGSYNLQVTDKFGCLGNETIQVAEKQCLDGFFIPNAFSPNKDGKNDYFRVYGTGIQSAEMQIFNRFGEMVFKSNENPPIWNGLNKRTQAICVEGNYVYLIKLTDRNGVTHALKGNLMLVK